MNDNLEDMFKNVCFLYGQTPKTKKVCNDQFCATFLNGKVNKCARKNVIYDFRNKTINLTKKNIIAVILESPHKYEFDQAGNALGPAMGSTGRLFFKKFNLLFSKSKLYRSCIKINTTYNIVFINSIQYQTSCGNSLRTMASRTVRDQIWLYMFHEKGSINFLTRLKCLNPTCIINLCTKGVYNLQLEVDNSIKSSNNYKGIYTYGTHPSTWNFDWSTIF